MNQLRNWVAARLGRGTSIALAAVTWASGSTARGTDALMAMDESGAMTGTVGGGFAEGQTITVMRGLFSSSAAPAQDLRFDLSPEANLSQMTCGGALTIHLERIESGSGAAQALIACFARVDAGAQAGVVFFDVPGRQTGAQPATWTAAERIAVPFSDDYSAIDERAPQTDAPHRPHEAPLEQAKVEHARASLLAEIADQLAVLHKALRAASPGFRGAAILSLGAHAQENVRAFWLGFSPDPTVYIFGAGHVGLATCEAASLAGFSVVVTDDRAELLTPERFPRARALRCIESFAEPLAAGPNCRAIAPGPQDCALILTRKPDIDREMLASLLQTRAGYIGLIGSKAKRTGIFASLKESGFPDANLARVHAPIGLAIGARTPEEISISIVAEIIAVRAGLVPAVKPLSEGAMDGAPAGTSESGLVGALRASRR